MRIECPGCEAAYEVPQAQIRPGRSVRCARCGLQWRPGGEQPPEPEPADFDLEAAAESAAPVADAASEEAPPGSPLGSELAPPGSGLGLRRPAAPGLAAAAAARAAERRPTPELAAWGAGWAISLIVLAGLLLSAAHWRQAVMRDWPPSIRLYVALGASPGG